MHPNLFNGVISPHSFMIIIGFILCCLLDLFRAKQYNMKWWEGLYISVIVFVFAVVGARLLFTVENFEYVLNEGFKLWDGVSFFGTVLFMPLFLLLFCKVFKKDFILLLDFVVPAVLVELASIRIGCFLSGCCYGRPASWGVAMYFQPNVLRIPVQIIECVFDVFIIVTVLLYEKRNGIPSGMLYPLFLVLYGTVRFVLEFFRENETVFTHSHIFAILSILVGVYFFVYTHLKKKILKR